MVEVRGKADDGGAQAARAERVHEGKREAGAGDAGTQACLLELGEVGVDAREGGVGVVITDVPPAPHLDRSQTERMVREDLGEQQVGPQGAGEDAVDGEVADLLQMTELRGDTERGRDRSQGAMAGQHPPADDLHPLPCE